jgi:hypothetical protein
MSDHVPEPGSAETTVRGFIESLRAAAADLPEGLDAVIELGICDGRDTQLIDDVDVDIQQEFSMDTAPPVRTAGWVIIRGHWHPGESPGKILRGWPADADDELRKLTEGDGPG